MQEKLIKRIKVLGKLQIIAAVLSALTMLIIYFVVSSELNYFRSNYNPILGGLLTSIFPIILISALGIANGRISKKKCSIQSAWSGIIINDILLEVLLLAFAVLIICISPDLIIFFAVQLILMALIAGIKIITMKKHVQSLKLGWQNIRTFAVCAVITLILGVGTIAAQEISFDTDTTLKPKAGGFNSFTMQGFDGNTYTEEVFKGKKLTFVNIWGTFCSPCIEEMPDLEKINNERTAEGVQIIGLCADLWQGKGIDEDLLEKGRYIIDTTGVTYINLIPSAEIASGVLRSVISVPTTYVLDENGNVLGTVSGSRTEENWNKLIDNYLEKVK